MSSTSSNSPQRLNLPDLPEYVIESILQQNEEMLENEEVVADQEQLKFIESTIINFSREKHRRSFVYCLEELNSLAKFYIQKKDWVLKWLANINLNDIEPYSEHEVTTEEQPLLDEANLEDITDELLEHILSHNIDLLRDSNIAADPGEIEKIQKHIMRLSKEQHTRKLNMCLYEINLILIFNKGRRSWVLRWLQGIDINDIVAFDEPWVIPDDRIRVLSRKRPYD